MRAPFLDIDLIPELGAGITQAALNQIVANLTPLITVRKDGTALTIEDVLVIDGDTVRFTFAADAFGVGDYTVSFNADAFSNNGLSNLSNDDVTFTVAAPRIEVSGPLTPTLDGTGYTVDVNALNTIDAIYVSYIAPGGAALDYSTIDGGEITLSRIGGGPSITLGAPEAVSLQIVDGVATYVTFSETYQKNYADLTDAELAAEGITEFRYNITSADLAAGVYRLSYTANAWADADGNTPAAQATVDVFVEGATAELINPGTSIDVVALSERGYIDVTFTAPTSGTINVLSITDAEAEFTLVGDGVGTITVDDAQAPVSLGGLTYRYWTTGSFADVNDVQIVALDGGWTVTDDTTGRTDDISGQEYIDVRVSNITGTFDPDSLTNAQITLTYDGVAITIAENRTAELISDSGSELVYRYTLTEALADGATVDKLALVVNAVDPITNPVAVNATLALVVVSDATASEVITKAGQLDDAQSYFDLQLTAAGGETLPTALPLLSEIKVKGANASALMMLDGDVLRVFFDAPTTTGDVTVTIAQDALDNNRALSLAFAAVGPQANIVDPSDSDAVPVLDLNNRGYVDLALERFATGTLSLGSVTDLAAEFMFVGGDIVFDDTQAPIWLNPEATSGDYIFRFWTIGEFTAGTTIELIAGSFATNTGTVSTGSGPVGFDSSTLNISYLDVAYEPNANNDLILDLDGADVAGNEITLAGSGLGTAALNGEFMVLGDGNLVRYFITGAFTSGTVDVNFVAGSFASGTTDAAGVVTENFINDAATQSFATLQLQGSLTDPVNGSVQDVVTINNRGFVDVAFTPPSYASGVDIDSVIDLAPEVVLSTLDGTSIAVDETQAAVHLRSEANGVEVFRIWFVGEFAGSVVANNVTVEFIGGSFDWIGTDGGTITAIGATNEVTANAIADGANVVVNFSLGDTQTLDIASVTASDFTFVKTDGTSITFDSISARGPPGEFSLVFAAADVTSGAIAAGDAGTLNFAAGAWDYNGTASEAPANVSLSIDTTETASYIDVKLEPLGGTIDLTTLDGDEFTFSGTGAGTAQINTAIEVMDLGDSVFRFFLAGAFTTGTVSVDFAANAWADTDGNLSIASSEKFRLIEALQDGAAPRDGEAQTSRVFFIDIAGSITLEVPGISEPLLEIRGEISFEFGDFVKADGSTVFRFSVNAGGTVDVYKLGNIGSAAARFILETSGVSATPQFWGVATVQTNFGFLEQFGVYLSGSATLQVNLTGEDKVETLKLEGIPGDQIGTATGTLGLNTGVSFFTPIAVSGTVSTAFENAGVTLGGDATIELVKKNDGKGTSQWRVTDGSKQYFVDIANGNATLSAEDREYTLTRNSAVFEILGSLKLVAPGDDLTDPILATLEGGFYLKISDERFEVFAIANASIGDTESASGALISGRAEGLFIIDFIDEGGNGVDDRGVAGSFTLELSADANAIGNLPENIFKLDASVRVIFNTTQVDQEFEVPTSFLPFLAADAPSTLTIYGAKPALGQDEPARNAKPGIYFVLRISGSITLFNAVTLNGFFEFSTSADETRITGFASANIDYIGAVQGTVDLRLLTVSGSEGIVGRLTLLRVAGTPGEIAGTSIPSLSMRATLVLEVNSFATGYILDDTVLNDEDVLRYDLGETLPDGVTQRYGPDPITDLPGNTGIKLGDVALQNGLTLIISGELIIFDVIILEGDFYLSIQANPEVELTASFNVRATLVGLASFDLQGGLILGEGGLAIYANIAVDFNLANAIRVAGQGTFALSTFTIDKSLFIPGTGAQTVLSPGFMFEIQGSADFLGFATASGRVFIEVSASRFTVEFDLSFGLGGLNVAAQGGLTLIYSGNTVQGFALLLNVTLDANIAGAIDIEAGGLLMINTTSNTVTLNGRAIAEKSFSLVLTGEVTFLKVLTFDAAFSIIVSGNEWRVDFSASMDFFGIATMSVSGWFDNNGYFNLSLRGQLVLGSSSFGLTGNFSIDVGYEPILEGDTVVGTRLFVSGGASVSLRAFGISWGTVSVNFSFFAEGAGRVPVTISADASVRINFGLFKITFRVSMSFNVGYIELPRPIFLAGNETGDLRLFGSGALYANVGTRGSSRDLGTFEGDGTGFNDESYQIYALGDGTTQGQKLRVVAGGREQIFDDVTSFVFDGGQGNDYLYVDPTVTIPVTFRGGEGIDTLDYQGSGLLTVNDTAASRTGSGAGDQISIGGNAAAGSVVNGSEGNDYIFSTSANAITINAFGGNDVVDHKGDGAAIINGGAGNDALLGGSAGDTINGDGGNDEIDARGGANTVNGGTGTDRIWSAMTYAGVQTFDGGTKADNDTVIFYGTGGADTLTVSESGSIFTVLGGNTTANITDVKIVQIHTLGGADKVTVNPFGASATDTLFIDDDREVETPDTTDVTNNPDGPTDTAADEVIIIGTNAADIFTFSDGVNAAGNATGAETLLSVTFQGISSGAVSITREDTRRADGDALTILAGEGADQINASALTGDLMALTLKGEGGNDTIVGSRFNDVIDGGAGSDTVTGGEGFDQFFETDGIATDNDRLIETFADEDFGLFENYLLVGNLLTDDGLAGYETAAIDDDDAIFATGDVWSTSGIGAGQTTVEALNGLYETITINGGSGDATFVVNDIDGKVRVGNTLLNVTAFDGAVTLDNGAGTSTEFYLINAPTGSNFTVTIADTGGTDRLLYAGGDLADLVTVTETQITSEILVDAVDPLNNVGAATLTVNYTGIEVIEVNTANGADVVAVRGNDVPVHINTGAGFDTINIGSNAGIERGVVYTGGTLNNIDALIDVDGFDRVVGTSIDRGFDTLNIDDSADSVGDTGVNTIGLQDRATPEGRMEISGFDLSVAGITYFAIEQVRLDLGNTATDVTLDSTGLQDATTINFNGGADAIDIYTINGPLTVSLGEGDDAAVISDQVGNADTVNGILYGLLSISGDGGTDTLYVNDSGDNIADANNTLSATQITGFGIMVGIDYFTFEALTLETSNGANGIHIIDTHSGTTLLRTGDENVPSTLAIASDVINITAIGGDTRIELGQGNDIVRVNYDADGRQTFLNGLDSGDPSNPFELILDGEGGSDFYEIGLAGSGTSTVIVADSGTASSGIDNIEIKGTNEDDLFLFRANAELNAGIVAAVALDLNGDPTGEIERVQYDRAIDGDVRVNGRDGDDTFVLDDTLAGVLVFGDAGNDIFQVGQLFNSPRDSENPFNGLSGIDYYRTVQVTLGFLSRGISVNATLNGGIGEDSFTVYSNQAQLFLFGNEDDDNFTVRSFVKVDPSDSNAPFTNINGGQGADFIEYNVNAPVVIDGGDGFDILTVIGGEFGDDYVITDGGVFGAGLYISYTGLEKIVVDALQGNDTFFIQGTSEGVALDIVGGTGSDTFNVGGSDLDGVTTGGAITVVSNSLNGHSGLIQTTVSSDDPYFNEIFAQDVVASVDDNDEPQLIFFNDLDALRVFESPLMDQSLVLNTYRIALTRAPDEDVTVSITPTVDTEGNRAAGAAGVAINGSATGAILTFTADNWYIPQEVTVIAIDDTLAEGKRVVLLRHNVTEGTDQADEDPYDAIVTANVAVNVIDNDVAEVLLFPVDDSSVVDVANDNVVGESLVAAGDAFNVVLSRAPTGPVTINLDFDGNVSLSDTTLSFDSGNWNEAQTVTVAANDDNAPEGVHFARITPSIADDSRDAFLGITNDDVALGIAANINRDIAQERTADVLYTSVDVEILRGTTAYDDTFIEYWSVTVNGREYRFGVPTATEAVPPITIDLGIFGIFTIVNGIEAQTITASDIATLLADAINADTQQSVTALAVGDVLRLTDSDGFTLRTSLETIRADHGFLVTPAAGDLQVQIEGAAFEVDASDNTGAPLTVTGDRAPEVITYLLEDGGDGVNVGETWRISTEEGDVIYTAKLDDTLQEVVLGLIEGFDSTDISASPLYALAWLDLGTEGDVDIEAGFTWRILLNGREVSYTANAGDILDGYAGPNGVGAAFAAEINKIEGVRAFADTATGRILVAFDFNAGGFSFFGLSEIADPDLETTTVILDQDSELPPVILYTGIMLYRTPGTSSVPAAAVEIARFDSSTSDDVLRGATIFGNNTVFSTTHWQRALIAVPEITGIIEEGEVYAIRVGAEITVGNGLEFTDYDYTVGANGENLTPNVFDFIVYDDDAPTVEIVESGGSTDVAERADGDVQITDTFDIFLTGAPATGTTVTVEVTPLETRTYNSQLAFDADANFGENERVQVQIAAPLASLTVGGTATAGEIWSITVFNSDALRSSSQTVTHVVQVGESIATIINSLRSKLDELADYAALTSEDDANTIDISYSGTAKGFFIEASISPDTRGAFDIRTVQDFSFRDVLEIEMTGIPTAGEIWSLTYNGTLYTHTVMAGDSLSNIAASFAERMIAAEDLKTATGARDYDIIVDGRTISITAIDPATAVATASGSINTRSSGEIGLRQYVVFDETNWMTPQTITVLAIDDEILDGGDALVFGEFNKRVNSIRGPVTFFGGQSNTDTSLQTPILLPGEINLPLPAGTIDNITNEGDGVIRITDFETSHTNRDYGARPGFEPRINEVAAIYDIATINGEDLSGRIDITSVSQDILSFVDENGLDVSLNVNGTDAVLNGDALFFGTPGQADLAALDWLRAYLQLDGKLVSGMSISVTLTKTPGGSDSQTFTVTPSDEDLYFGPILRDLAEQIRLGGLFDAVATVNLLGETRLSIAELSDAGNGFDISVSITGAPDLTTTISGVPVQNQYTNASWTLAALQILNTSVGETWDLSLNGGAAKSVTVADGDIAEVTNGLAALLANALKPVVSGSSITVEGILPEDFSAVVGATYSYAPVNLNLRVNEETQIDTLIIYNNESPAVEEAVLTDTRLTGLGMAGDTPIGGEVFAGGLTYFDIEVLDLRLGKNTDRLTIETTHSGTTLIDTAGGDDEITVKTTNGHLFLTTGEGDDRIDIGSDQSLVDQITGLITIDMGGDAGDTLNVNDAGDTNDNIINVSEDRITGMDMPLVSEIQLISVRAVGGTFTLTDGVNVSAAISVLDGTQTAAESAKAAIDALLGTDATVTVTREGSTTVFRVEFAGKDVGLDITDLIVGDTTGLLGDAQTSVEVLVSELRKGATSIDLNNVYKVDINATGGTFVLIFDLADGTTVQTDPIAWNATTTELAAALEPVLNPNNAFPFLPYTDNFAVIRQGDTIFVTLQGQLREATARVDTRGLTGEVRNITYAIDSVTAGEGFAVITTDLATASLKSGTADTVFVVFALATDTAATIAAKLAAQINAAQGPMISATADAEGNLTITSRSGERISVAASTNLVNVSSSDLAVINSAQDGIAYQGVSILNIYAGAGDDVLNVTGTSANTLIELGDGNERIFVGSTAAYGLGDAPLFLEGHLNDINGVLDIVAGAGRHVLMISDEAAIAGDGTADAPVVITDDRAAALDAIDLREGDREIAADNEIYIVGLAPAAITFGADGGDFFDGITIWTGFGDDTILIDGTSKRDDAGDFVTWTTLNTGLGDDTVTVDLDSNDGLLILNAQGPYEDLFKFGDFDTVDASTTSIDLIIFGGQDRDIITGGTADDIIFGDRGFVAFISEIGGERIISAVGSGVADMNVGYGQTYHPTAALSTGQLIRISTIVYANGDVDELYGLSGEDIILGGEAGDTITDTTDSGILIGDYAFIDFHNVTLDDALKGLVNRIETRAYGLGGADTITGTPSNDIVIGGEQGDIIVTRGGDDIVIGDAGYIDYITIDNDPTDLDEIGAVRSGYDGDDVIDAGAGADMIIGGNSTTQDTIQAGDGDNVVIGDLGVITGKDTGPGQDGGLPLTLDVVRSIAQGFGGTDIITHGTGEDVIIGGTGADEVIATSGEAGRDIIFGDGGIVSFRDAQSNGSNVTDLIMSYQPRVGDADIIAAGDGGDIVIGGAGADEITVGDGDSIVAGDAVIVTGADSGLIDPDQALITLTSIATIAPTIGAGDLINIGDGFGVVIGGLGTDEITKGDGDAIIIGDNGRILTNTEASRSDPHILLVETTTPELGAFDIITTGAGDDIIIGGAGGDIINASHGDNIVMGGGALITGRDVYPTDGQLIQITLEQITPVAPELGDDDDTITTGLGRDIVMGGAGADTIVTNDGAGTDGDDVVVGDHALMRFAISKGVEIPVEISSTDPLNGDGDEITTGTGRDIIIGGTGGDIINAGAGNDLVFGDYATISGLIRVEDLPLGPGRVFDYSSIFVTNADLGGDDTITAGSGDDVVLGQTGNDTIFGGAGDDDIIGGHNVAQDAAGNLANDGDDRIDAGAGDDVVLGDSGTIYRTFSLDDPRMRALEDGLIYGVTPGVNDGEALITDSIMRNPDGTAQRVIVIYNHSETADPLGYGDDYIAGGADDDMIFGQMGNDTIQGDGTTDFADERILSESRDLLTNLQTLVPSADDWAGVGTDGDDYIEGNGGNDLIFGNLGQDDIVGGSSSLFEGLSGDVSNRPDGDDVIFGGSGTAIARNDAGDESDEGHARDADTIAGDNANIYRLVGTNDTDSGAYLTFNYDTYSGTLRIIPRAVELLDYTEGGIDIDAFASLKDRGGADEIRGEAGDDTIYGQRGNDVLYGDGQSDDLIGGTGHDWISGGTGSDGVIGDDGRIMTSRNSTEFGEPLNGVAALDAVDVLLTTDEFDAVRAVLYFDNLLVKRVNLTPFSTNPNDPSDRDWNASEANDIIFGGLGDDYLHGGVGDDAISGAEALPYSETPRAMNGQIISYDTPINTGDAVGYNGAAQEGTPLMSFFDPSNPRGELRVGDDPFFLNFDPTEGPVSGVSENGLTSDGDDKIFGGIGNDAIVGGTGRDQMYGGYGDDFISADDDTTGNNNRSDDDISYEDFAFGGAGEDILIANNVGDRLIDWAGEFNSYYTPFQSVGEPTVINDYSLGLVQYIYALGTNDGIDPTRADDTAFEGVLDGLPAIYELGEPFGELGIVVSSDTSEYSEQFGQNRYPGRGGAIDGAETPRIAPIPDGDRLLASPTGNFG
ncbi:calcium-binding protein [Yoonia litorea]|uniref:calcium-binding protein n=1 Tax=Yoonia litorea TaxID=1123755 RepID=UPI001A963BD7|nr:calcium-binding protein [Yoonia litorea]